MSDMDDRVREEIDAFDTTVSALRNAFGYVDDPEAWSEDPEEHVEVWESAVVAASRVAAAAEKLAEAARRVARRLDEALDAAEAS